MPEEIVHISQLKFDPQNARQRTERSSYMIKRSLEKFGGMRSIVIDPDSVIRAGSGTAEEAGQLGIEKVRIVEADGNELIAVRRHGLTEEEWKEYAVADNRSSDLSEWCPDVLLEINEEVDLSDWFREEELRELIEDLGKDEIIPEEDEFSMDSPKEISCQCPNCGERFTKLIG